MSSTKKKVVSSALLASDDRDILYCFDDYNTVSTLCPAYFEGITDVFSDKICTDMTQAYWALLRRALAVLGDEEFRQDAKYSQSDMSKLYCGAFAAYTLVTDRQLIIQSLIEFTKEHPDYDFTQPIQITVHSSPAEDQDIIIENPEEFSAKHIQVFGYFQEIVAQCISRVDGVKDPSLRKAIVSLFTLFCTKSQKIPEKIELALSQVKVDDDSKGASFHILAQSILQVHGDQKRADAFMQKAVDYGAGFSVYYHVAHDALNCGNFNRLDYALKNLGTHYDGSAYQSLAMTKLYFSKLDRKDSAAAYLRRLGEAEFSSSAERCMYGRSLLKFGGHGTRYIRKILAPIHSRDIFSDLAQSILRNADSLYKRDRLHVPYKKLRYTGRK